MPESTQHTGRCLCGAVSYVVRGPLRAAIACHCSQCRRTSGHYAVMTSAQASDVVVTAGDALSWYRSSDSAERGFCRICGSNLFWRQFASPTWSITAGTLDTPTGIVMQKHIFVADQSDYYELHDGLPKLPAW
jgi:hypothetical protein